MSEGKGTQYERTRAAILKELFYEFEDGGFSKVGFEKILDSIGIGDDRTVRKYWKKLSDMGYIRQINGTSARLSPEIVANGGRITPLEAVAEACPEAVR